MARKKKKELFALSSFHHYHNTTTMTLILISVMLLLPFYYIPQFAWGQPQEPAQDNNAHATAKTEHVQVGDINIAYKQFGQ
ncbi:MAG TPA: hypothetical protein VFR94_09465, partial [Nitrososphaeraceae archaeon]|nr:hypothetical protein [Nitrososphaeraceae archaeon]